MNNSRPYDTEAPVDIDRPGMRLLAQTPTAPAPSAAASRAPMDAEALRQSAPAFAGGPSAWGWKGRLHRASGGLIRLQPGLAEKLVREAEIVARSTFPGLRMITCAHPKGGSGVTPTTLILAAVLADLRREGIVAWDASEYRGTLGYRAEVSEPATTVADVYRARQSLSRPDVSPGELVAYMRRQPEGHLVLASAQTPQDLRHMGRGETETIHQLLGRRFSTIITDTGDNETSPAWQYIMEQTDVLVVPTAPTEDHLLLAVNMLALLDQDEKTHHLVDSAILVVTSAGGAHLSPVWQQFWADRGIRVLYCPPDPEISRPEAALRVSALTVQSRRAWTIVAAAVAEAAATSTRPAATPVNAALA